MSFRGGGNRGGGNRVPLPFGLDYADILQSSETTEKPQYILPVNSEPSENEKLAAKQAINFAKLMSEGPFYTGDLDLARIATTATNKNAMAHSAKEKIQDEEAKNQLHNVSEDGIQRYSDKYKKRKKTARTIEEHPYQLQFFPEELYLVMGVSSKQKKLLSLSKFKSGGGLREFLSSEKHESMKEEEKLKALKEQMLNQVGADDDEGDRKEDKDEHSEPESVDDEFDDEDDDDYNAEKYFDDGDDDMGDDGGDDDEAAF